MLRLMRNANKNLKALDTMEVHYLEDQGTGERIRLKWILEAQGMRLWTGLNCLRTVQGWAVVNTVMNFQVS
jgi:hypothetical protein